MGNFSIMKDVKLWRRFGGRRPLAQTGDTIVEVLIAIVLISMILGGAYIASRASLTGTRKAEEHGEALKIAESQTEDLRALPPVPTGTPPPVPAFCYAQNGGAPTLPAGFVLPPQTDTDPLTAPPYPAQCVVQSDGTQNPTGFYHIGILYDTANQVYVVHVRWSRAGGGGNDEVSLAYRPPS